MIRAYRELDMQELEILNLTLEKIDVDPSTPTEGRVWFSNGTHLPKIRADGRNRLLIAPDDDFNLLPIKDTLLPEDTMLIWDIEHLEYKRIAAAVILSKMSTVKDVFKTIHSEYGVKNIVAAGADELYFAGDGILLKTVGNDIGSKQVKYDLMDQVINSVLAGPVDVTTGKPTFRHLTDGDLPSSYNPEKWNTAVDFTQVTEGNPTNVTMLDLGYIVVTTIGNPGLDENLPTEKAVRVAIGLAIAALIDTSPDLLDTLNELAAALGDDPNFATTITNLIAGKEPALGNPGTDGWILSSTSAGARSWIAFPSVTYTNAVLTPVTQGGIVVGSTFLNKTMQEMWDSFLYPYQVPAFSNLAVTGQATIVEIGQYILGGNKTFTWSSTNPANIAANSIQIINEVGAVVLASGLPNTGSAVVPTGGASTITVSPGLHKYSITATNSIGGVIAKAYLAFNFYSPYYSGSGASGLNAAGIQALAKAVSPKASTTVNYNPVAQKMYRAYDASYGYLTSIKDPNGFDITSSFTVRTVSFIVNGITMNYYVYESNNITTQTNFTIMFNY